MRFRIKSFGGLVVAAACVTALAACSSTSSSTSSSSAQATGTPISNTIAEVFTMQRYHQYDELKAKGIHHFDAWASTFGRVVTGWELDATGVNYKVNSRFAKFQNVPELASTYRTFADVITKTDLQSHAATQGKTFPVPRIKGGKPRNIVVERSPAQEAYIGIETEVLDDNGQPVVLADGV